MSYSFHVFPTIKISEDLILRQFQRHDAHAYFEHMRHAQITPWLPDDCIPNNIDQAIRQIDMIRLLFARKKAITWAIVDRHNDRFIGSCGFESWHSYHRRLELAYDLYPPYWRQGITTLALIHIFHFAFSTIKAQRIEAFTLPQNNPSNQILLHLGFKHEAILRKYRRFKDAFVDVNVMGLTDNDFKSHASEYQAILDKAKPLIRP